MDLEGYKLLWPGEEPRIGKRFEMNDHEAEIVGICKASRTFQTFPVVYTRYSQALRVRAAGAEGAVVRAGRREARRRVSTRSAGGSKSKPACGR